MYTVTYLPEMIHQQGGEIEARVDRNIQKQSNEEEAKSMKGNINKCSKFGFLSDFIKWVIVINDQKVS